MKRTKNNTLYKEIAERIITLIYQGALKEGEKIPSIRDMSSQLGVSLNTIKESYLYLENQKFIAAVPQSGFYVQNRNVLPREQLHQSENILKFNPQKMSLCKIYAAIKESGSCFAGAELGIAITDEKLWPTDKLYRYYNEALRSHDKTNYQYCFSPGLRELREQVALFLLRSNIAVSIDDIIITSGCSESIYLALQTLCKPGDTIAIESPVYFNLLHVCDTLRLNVIEIPNSHEEGMNLETLNFAIEQFDIKAIFATPSFSNPIGSCMNESSKKELVRIASANNIPLIEDAIYAELSHSGKIPSACKSFDQTGNVIHCGSFSKILAPGIRLGWIIPGKYFSRIEKHKDIMSIGNPALPQMAVARFLKDGGVERYLRKLRSTLAKQTQDMREFILATFPKETKVNNPSGGFLLWVELPEHIDSLKLYQSLIEKNIIIAPGAMFTMKGKYKNHIRINAGIWNKNTEAQLQLINETIIEENCDV